MPNYKFYCKVGGTDWPVGWQDSYFTNGSDHLFGDGLWHRVYPGVERDMSIEYDIWDHKYRRKLKGKVLFLNNQVQADYTLMSQIFNTSVEILFRVEQTCTTTASDWWEGYFSIIDGKWDSDRGLFNVEPSPNDSYRLIEELGDKEFNLYDLHPNVTVGIASAGVPVNYNTGFTDSVTWADYISIHTPPDPYTVWADYTFDYTDVAYGQYNHYFQRLVSDVVDFGNGRGLLLKDAIQYVVETLNPQLLYKSTFFENDTVVGGGSGGTSNYVTTTNPNPLNGMVLMQKSNIRPTSNPATKWLISFNDLVEIIKSIFNVDWFIDDDGNFRIEHWSYFENTMGSDIDLTQLDGGKWANHKNKWSYKIETMPNREHFEFVESANIDFIGQDIVYNALSTYNRYKDNVRSISVPVATDAMSLWQNRYRDSNNEGWVLLTVASDVILDEVGRITSYTLPNNHLSWANLHWNYWRHGRVIQAGYMNGMASSNFITFFSYQRNIKQTEITYPECCGTFDPMAYKITGLGEGQVRQAEYRLIDGTVKSVFFYHDVNRVDPPTPETYYLSTTGYFDFMINGVDKIIWYG